MKIGKYIILLTGLGVFGCQDDALKEGRREINILEESVEKIILDRKEMGFIGNVRSALEYEFDSDSWNDETIKIKEGKYHSISADELIEEIQDVIIRESNSYLFDKSGKLIKDVRYVEHDNIHTERIINYKFDNKQKLIEQSRSNFEGEVYAEQKFIYDDKERLVEFRDFHHSGVTIMDVSYFEDTIQINEVHTNNGDTTYTEIRKYNRYGDFIDNDPNTLKEFDDRGNLISLRYDPLGGDSPTYSTTYDYDARNNKVRETEYDSLGHVVETIMFYYNEKDELIQEIEIDSSNTEIKRFDKLGNVFEYTSVPFNEEEEFYGFWSNFDRYGNIIKTVDFHKDERGKLVERVSKTEFEYDKVGNWVLQRVYVNDSLLTMFKREVKYY